MSFTRRGFLSLVGTGAAALAIEKALPQPFRMPLAKVSGRLVPAAEEAPILMHYCLPFAPELDGFQEIVEPGGIVRLVARTQLLFRPARLIFAGGFDLSQWSLLQVDAQGENQLAGEIPADIFTPDKFGTRVEMDVTRPGEEIILALRNHSNVEAEFTNAAMVGLAVR
jgi:hypothetical protein